MAVDTAVVRDSEYDFGKERFDLVLFSWTMPPPELVQKVADSLKPGGIVVMECGADWVGRNGVLALFNPLQIVRYEIVSALRFLCLPESRSAPVDGEEGQFLREIVLPLHSEIRAWVEVCSVRDFPAISSR